jgi:hypothetical protein
MTAMFGGRIRRSVDCGHSWPKVTELDANREHTFGGIHYGRSDSPVGRG